ncbi:hypothetical protein DPMN_036599 [Dreissena polymorpha]|uniref:Uncharacterized protein n=1 Tax=Dreissena polymorpha TaxID=45954 RepID=A0A9D4M9Q4_DREPO|nr:hypothetical protein DPMN_036599 [Dreissena polymorpha]
MCQTTGGIIGIKRQDQAKDRFCITWSVRSEISNSTIKLFNQNDNDEDIGIFKYRTDGTCSKVSKEEECIKTMMQLFGSYDIFGVHEEENRLFSISFKNVATNDITDDLLTCDSRGKTLLKKFAEKRLKEQNVQFYAPVQKVQSKTFA